MVRLCGCWLIMMSFVMGIREILGGSWVSVFGFSMGYGIWLLICCLRRIILGYI